MAFSNFVVNLRRERAIEDLGAFISFEGQEIRIIPSTVKVRR